MDSPNRIGIRLQGTKTIKNLLFSLGIRSSLTSRKGLFIAMQTKALILATETFRFIIIVIQVQAVILPKILNIALFKFQEEA